MANIIQIKRGASDGSLIPTTLAIGELAYAENGSKLYIGESGNNITPIGGKIGVTVQGYDANIVSDANYVATANDFTNDLSSKLSGIATSANNYALPAATGSVLGGVIIGSGVSVSSGTISVPEATGSAAGLMSASDKGNLDTLAAYIASDTDETTFDASTAYTIGEKVYFSQSFDTVTSYLTGEVVGFFLEGSMTPANFIFTTDHSASNFDYNQADQYFGPLNYKFTSAHSAGAFDFAEVVQYNGILDKLSEVFALFDSYEEVADIASLIVAPTDMTLDGGTF